MANNIFSGGSFFGCAVERQGLVAELEGCVEKHQDGGWCDLRHLLPALPGKDTCEIKGFVRDLEIVQDSDETSLYCTMKNATIGYLFFNISPLYPGLVFRMFESEQIYIGYDKTVIFRNGTVIVNERHDHDQLQAFFDGFGQVINPGYVVVTENNRHLLYKRKNIAIEEGCYDSRGDNINEMTIILEDVDGKIYIVPMNSVRRFNKYDAIIDELKGKVPVKPVEKFSLGQLQVTKSISESMKEDGKFKNFIDLAISRHTSGDWGAAQYNDCHDNELALKEGGRLLSTFVNNDLWITIITDADRSATRVLFQKEYEAETPVPSS